MNALAAVEGALSLIADWWRVVGTGIVLWAAVLMVRDLGERSR